MTKEEFLGLIKRPEAVVSLQKDTLVALLNQFPYCQPLRYLYLLQLHGQSSVSYDQQLKVTAAYAPDRRRLFRLLRPEPDMVQGTADDVQPAIAPLGEEAVHLPAFTEEVTGSVGDAQFPETVIYPAASSVAAALLPEENKDEAENNPEPVELPSAQDIVTQRLKELNLWQDEKAGLPVISIAEPEQETGVRPEIKDGVQAEMEVATAPGETENPAASGHTPFGSVSTSQSVSEEEVTESENLYAGPVSLADANVPVKDLNTTPTEDALDEIILESLLEARLKNADYSIAASPESTEEKRLPLPSSSAHAESRQEEVRTNAEKDDFSRHQSEIHSFSEWLRMNRSPAAPVETPPQVVPDQVATDSKRFTSGIAGNIKPDSESPVFSSTGAVPSIAETPRPMNQSPAGANPLSQKVDVQEPKATEQHRPKQVYVKSVDATGPAGKRHPEPAADFRSPLLSGHPGEPWENSSLTRADHSTGAPSLKPAREEEDTESDQNLIPERKPIPDPSLVDTDPPKSRVPSGELIDKFIRQEPRITPAKSTFYSPVNMAKRSIQEPEDLITETLASIYAQQGNFQKALQFYEKLSLKFPEKSRYFAALIEDLKKKINS
ncbi:MAG: hypothetical protein JNL88_08330 [Bacteroidia bacterium]|nr:hypothetical protein [Bacteroidia bacterium]